MPTLFFGFHDGDSFAPSLNESNEFSQLITSGRLLYGSPPETGSVSGRLRQQEHCSLFQAKAKGVFDERTCMDEAARPSRRRGRGTGCVQVQERLDRVAFQTRLHEVDASSERKLAPMALGRFRIQARTRTRASHLRAVRFVAPPP